MVVERVMWLRPICACLDILGNDRAVLIYADARCCESGSGQLGAPVMPALPSSLRQLVEFSRTDFRTCAVFLMQDRDIQSVHRLYDSTTAQLIPSYQARPDAGNVNIFR
jgi:hypothetical protein